MRMESCHYTGACPRFFKKYMELMINMGFLALLSCSATPPSLSAFAKESTDGGFGGVERLRWGILMEIR